jgi:multicomponent Na+:H+ antiporter subunit D
VVPPQGALQEGSWIFVAALLFSSLVNVVLFFRIFEIGYGFTATTAMRRDGGEAAAIREAPLSMLVPS